MIGQRSALLQMFRQYFTYKFIVISTHKPRRMGRVSGFTKVFTWLKIASKDKSLQHRKFYNASELYEIYRMYDNTVTNPTIYHVRSFTSQLNKIANSTSIKQFRSKYSKKDSYRYILISDHEVTLDIDNIRVSNRKTLTNTINTTTVTIIPESPSSTVSEPVATASIPTSGPTPISSSSHTNTQVSLFPTSCFNKPTSIYLKVTDAQIPSSIDTDSPIIITLGLPARLQSYSNLLNFQLVFNTNNNDNHESGVEESNDIDIDEGIPLESKSKMDSPEALFLFFGKKRAKKKIASNIDDLGCSDMLRAHIMEQVEKLQSVNLYLDGWKKIVRNDYSYNDYSTYQIYTLRNRATYLAMIYYLCLDYYNTCTSFADIVQIAMEKINNAHLVDFLPSTQHKTTFIIHSKRILLNWFREYRENDLFPNFIPIVNKEKLPPLLNANPELVTGLLRFCRTNINTLSVELVQNFLHSKALPELASIIQNEQETRSEYSIKTLLNDFGLKSLCIQTIQNWMAKLGFRYEQRKKTYYVDSHETESNVKYRSQFINRYFEYELLAHRWYSVTVEKRDELVKDGQISNNIGYQYTKNGKEFYEFHVDDCQYFHLACEHVPFGGYLSVRKPLNIKKVMIIGQDEVIMKQFIFSLLAWTLPDGSRPLIPKDEGMGLMISAFTCRELGFAYTIPPDVLVKVNSKRSREKYSDEKAATILFGTAHKPALTSTPFIRQLEYGQNKDGYWTYDHMVIQLEDCVDVLKTQFPEFDIVFLVDHSNDHDRLQPDGLNLNKIGVKYGGKQPIMRDTKLTSSSFFGPYHTKEYPLQKGDTQRLQFFGMDPGPCYLNKDELEERRYDRETGKKRIVNIVKSDLILSLKAIGVKDPKGNRKKLQELAQRHNVPIQHEQVVIAEGWVDKPKGSLQILYERGWIHPDKIHEYTKKGRKDKDVLGDNGACVSFSLDELMNQQEDFKNEMTLLQYHASKLDVILDRSPKCHPEIAGEGIEYGWAFSKQEYRRSPIVLKQTKAKFWDLVTSCLNNRGVMNLKRMRLCSKKARQYMKLYKAVEAVENSDGDENSKKLWLNKHSILEDSLKLYRKLQKKQNTHRSVKVMDIRSLEQEFCEDASVEYKNDDCKDRLIRSLVCKMITM